MTADLIQRLRFLASGQDDVRSQALTEAADALERTSSPAEAHDDERAAFEAWARGKGFRAERTLATDAAYNDSGSEIMWQAWQARAAINVQPKGIPPARDMDAATTDAAIHYTAGWNACREAMAQAPAPAPATGDTNGRRDGLRSAVHGRVAVGGYTPGALADLLWASHDVMSLNAELGLSMAQLVQLTQAVLTAVPCAAVAHQPLDAEMMRQARAECDDDYTKRGIFISGWLGAERAHGIGKGHPPVHGSEQ